MQVVPFFQVNLRLWGLGAQVQVHRDWCFVSFGLGPLMFGVEVWRDSDAGA